MTDLLIVRSKIKDFCEGCNVSSDFANALNQVIIQIIKKAKERAKANNRKTIQSKDL